MSAEDNINVGDTVQVVRGARCCGCCDSIGEIHIVKAVEYDIGGECLVCGEWGDGVYIEVEDSDVVGGGFMKYQLKKFIPPAPEDEAVRERFLNLCETLP